MKNRVYLMLLGFAAFTGMTFNVAKYSVQYFPPPVAASFRFGIAAIVMLGLLFFQRKLNYRLLRRNWKIFIVLGLIGIFGFNTLFFIGIKETAPLNGALIMGTNPLVTTLLAVFILKEPLLKRQLTGLFFALLGVGLVLTHGSIETLKSLEFSSGDLLILGGNLCWALYGVLGRKYVKDCSSMEMTSYTIIVGAIFLIPFSILTPGTVQLLEVPFSAWGAILFMAICSSVFGYFWWNRGMAAIGASSASLFFNMVPVFTMLTSILTGITISLAQGIGTLLVITGVVFASGIIRKRKPKVSMQM